MPGALRTTRAESDAGNGLLLAYEAGNHLHHYGGRVYKDGRYELSATRRGRRSGRRFDPFTPEQIGEIETRDRRAATSPTTSRGDPPPPDARHRDVRAQGPHDQGRRVAEGRARARSAARHDRRAAQVAAAAEHLAAVEPTARSSTLEAPCDDRRGRGAARPRATRFHARPTARRPRATIRRRDTPLVSRELPAEETPAGGLRRRHAASTAPRQGDRAARSATDRSNADPRRAWRRTDWAKLPSRLC